MAISDLFSKRRRRLSGDVPDIVTYDTFSSEFRTQLVYLIMDALGDSNHPLSERCYRQVVTALRREYGVFKLSNRGSQDHPYIDLLAFVEYELDVEHVLDAIELVMRASESLDRPPEAPTVKAVVHELNARFAEHGLGYQYEGREIIRTDSKLLHQEAVRPALALLNEKNFAGAQQEFLTAFEHHRHGREKDALTWALKALESTLKVICGKRKWPDGGQAKDLLDTVFGRGLIEPIWQSEFAGLRSVLESGVPTARNRRGAHGQGATVVTVPGYLAAFVLHQTAAAIVFLVEADKAKP
jgi:hypothetical protein